MKLRKILIFNLCIFFITAILFCILEYVGMKYFNSCWGLDIFQYVFFVFPLAPVVYFALTAVITKIKFLKENTKPNIVKAIVVTAILGFFWTLTTFSGIVTIHISLGGGL